MYVGDVSAGDDSCRITQSGFYEEGYDSQGRLVTNLASRGNSMPFCRPVMHKPSQTEIDGNVTYDPDRGLGGSLGVTIKYGSSDDQKKEDSLKDREDRLRAREERLRELEERIMRSREERGAPKCNDTSSHDVNSMDRN